MSLCFHPDCLKETFFVQKSGSLISCFLGVFVLRNTLDFSTFSMVIFVCVVCFFLEAVRDPVTNLLLLVSDQDPIKFRCFWGMSLCISLHLLLVIWSSGTRGIWFYCFIYLYLFHYYTFLLSYFGGLVLFFYLLYPKQSSSGFFYFAVCAVRIVFDSL